MALVQRHCRTFSSLMFRFGRTHSFCSSSSSNGSEMIKKSVFISQSKDIFTNLALEDWLYRHFDFTNHHVLMLWQNDPCVVIGRHQNPWLEANVPELANITDDGVKLARRNSGGGTVYHDEGNLNMTFFTPRQNYNRKYNLDLITRAVFREYGVKLERSTREDLNIRNCKVSGTAAKLGRPNAYHHCTLMVNVDKMNLRQALFKQDVGIETNATKSVKSKIINLCEDCPDVDVTTLTKAVGWEYLRTDALMLKDGGMELANRQNGFQMVNPTEQWFPGISELQNSLESWQWRYGKTPKFTISRNFPIPNHLVSNALLGDGGDHLTVTMLVENGIISDVTLHVAPGLTTDGFVGQISVVTNLKGCKFSHDALANFDWSIEGLLNDRQKFVTNCVRQVMTSV